MWLQRLVGLDPSQGGAGGASSDEEGQVIASCVCWWSHVVGTGTGAVLAGYP